jgi:L-seryl-tRNA(Ser) seleniumtransferase
MNPRPPSVDALRRHLAEVSSLPAPLLVDAARRAIRTGSDDVEGRAKAITQKTEQAILQPVINATGVLLHTNLGRAPLGVSREASYSNLELDLASGKRGDRSSHAGRLLARAAGAEDALVVNNGAAAVVLVLAAVAQGGEVVVSRGELVEIGGGFRIPDILRFSGARLVEVGTTNRTRLDDYLAALGPATTMILKVHSSNFRMVGFTRSASVKELAGAASAQGGQRLPVVMDLGSGLLDSSCPWLPGGPPNWLGGEPAVCQTLAEGADLVTFSGDKLLGGPQAGVVAGRAELVSMCRRHPLYRAFRPGGLVLAALQDVALAYLGKQVVEKLPLWRMAVAGTEELRDRAQRIGMGQVVACESVLGGGSLPGRGIPSVGISVEGDVRKQLRAHRPPVLARVNEGCTLCDLRTVMPGQDGQLRDALKGLAGG